MQRFDGVRAIARFVWLLCFVVAPAPANPPAASAPPPGTSNASDQGVTLNFVNADVRDVAKAILGDYLKLNYEIAANVQGTVTIQTNQPLARDAVLPALDEALSLNGMALVYSHGLYRIVPLAAAHSDLGPVKATGGASPGYGVELFHVKYVNAAALQKLLQPLTEHEGTVRVDPSRNLLIVEGTAEQRRTIGEDIALLDVNWLSGMTFELFTAQNMDAEELVKELNSVLGGLTSPAADVVKLVPIDRLNTVLAIAPQRRYLQQLRAWVTRLDKPGVGNDRRIFVYHVQNGRASDLEKTLKRTLFGSASQGGSEVQTQTAPRRPAAPPVDNLDATTGADTAGSDQSSGASRSYETVEGVNRQGMSSVHITGDESNNALVFLATPREYSVIESALRQLDVPPMQVLLEASIAEVSLTKNTQFGFQYFYQPSAKNTFILSNSTSPTITPSFPGFSYMFSNGNSIQAILDALGTVTHVDVISSPEVLVLNNQMARLEVGNEVPVLTAQSVSTVGTNAPVVNAVQYLDTGVILKVTPRVNRGGRVMMDVEQEVSGVSDAASSNIDSPTIQQRKITSSVSVEDGQTIALGGLFTNEITKTKKGFPYLQDIPVLGNLFGNNGTAQNKTELMVLITPHVVDDARKAQAVTDELRKKLPDVQPLFEQK
ncbi:MAG: type II secretion system secretin GspD [Alphaproteobacteria bacterium]|nr:type II secretion system secretin GspD [Alphaproteobacteria bacterium]